MNSPLTGRVILIDDHRLVATSCYGTETLRLLLQAFDDAWDFSDRTSPTIRSSSKRPPETCYRHPRLGECDSLDAHQMKDSRSTLSVTGLPSEHYVIDAQRLSLGLELDAVIKIRDRCAELVINRSNIRGVTPLSLSPCSRFIQRRFLETRMLYGTTVTKKAAPMSSGAVHLPDDGWKRAYCITLGTQIMDALITDFGCGAHGFRTWRASRTLEEARSLRRAVEPLGIVVGCFEHRLLDRWCVSRAAVARIVVAASDVFGGEAEAG